MRWSTHVVLSVNLAGAALLAAAYADLPVMAPEIYTAVLFGATVGSLLPDLDARESKIKYLQLGNLRPFEMPSILINHHFGHRGVLHSLLGLAVASAIINLLGPWTGLWFAVGASLGYFGHVLADSATKSGVPWLFPHTRRYHLLPKKRRVVTGSQFEEAIFAFSACLTLFMILQIGSMAG